MANLNQVRFYTPQDLYYYETDNRPLQDLQGNIELIAGQMDVIWDNSQAIPCQDTSTSVNVVLISAGSLASSALTDGQVFSVAIANTCTGPTVLSLNSGPSGSVLSNGNPLEGGELVSGNISFIIYDSGNWLLVSQNSGSFQVNSGSQPVSLVPNSQLESGTLPAVFSTLSTGTATVSGQAIFSSTVSASGGTSGGELVTLGQISSGVGEQAALIDWGGVVSDTVLKVGQTAYYNFSNMTTANMPLYISCGTFQIYEITFINLLYNSSDLTMALLPNNTTYSGQFGVVSMETSYTNQGQYYAPASSSPQYGAALYAPGVMDYFFFDDVNGGAVPPYLRTLKVWTGSATNLPTITAYGGGGVNGSTSSQTPGVCIGTSTWQGNAGTAWTSLGTLSQNSFVAGNSFSNLVLIKRLA